MAIRMKSQERRAAIVESAIHLFAEKGFRGATTRELAAALGVTEPVLYQHFRTKQDLYCAIIEAKSQETSGRAADLRRLAKSTGDLAFFSMLGDLVLERYEKDPELTRLIFFSCLERHELSDLFFERQLQEFYRLVSGYIRRRSRHGAFRKVNADLAARGFIGMVAYHGMLAMLYPGRFGKPNRKRVVEEMVSIFLRGISAAPTAAK
jgi:AcrR family transcriptional regulator